MSAAVINEHNHKEKMRGEVGHQATTQFVESCPWGKCSMPNNRVEPAWFRPWIYIQVGLSSLGIFSSVVFVLSLGLAASVSSLGLESVACLGLLVSVSSLGLVSVSSLGLFVSVSTLAWSVSSLGDLTSVLSSAVPGVFSVLSVCLGLW